MYYVVICMVTGKPMKTYYQEMNTTGFTFWKETLGCTVQNEFVCVCRGGGYKNVGGEIIRARLLTGALGLGMEETGEKIHMEEQV